MEDKKKRVISLSVVLILTAFWGGMAFAAQSVIIANTPLPVQEVAKPASQPFQTSGTAFIASDEQSATIELLTVPLGKRLVIEYATVLAGAGGGKMIAFIGTKLITTPNPDNSPFLNHALVMTEQGAINDPVTFTAAQPMRLYCDPGTKVLGLFSRSISEMGQSTLTATITISGYFIDVP